MPAVGHTTTAFASLALGRSEFLGLEPESIVLLPHPMRTREPKDVVRLAEAHVDRIVSLLTGSRKEVSLAHD